MLFQAMERGFVEHATEVEQLLADPRTTFVVVSTLEAAPSHEATYLARELLRARPPSRRDRRQPGAAAGVHRQGLGHQRPQAGASSPTTAGRRRRRRDSTPIRPWPRRCSPRSALGSTTSRSSRPAKPSVAPSSPSSRRCWWRPRCSIATSTTSPICSNSRHTSVHELARWRPLPSSATGASPCASRPTPSARSAAAARGCTTVRSRRSATTARRRPRGDLRRRSQVRGDRALGSDLADPGQGAAHRIADHDRRHWWRERLSTALEQSHALIADDPTPPPIGASTARTTACPGWSSTGTTDTLVIKLYTPAWFPHLARRWSTCWSLLSPERVVLRLSRGRSPHGETFGLSDGDTIVGEAPDRPVFFRERGLMLEADVVHGQKTGHFLDQRDNRGAGARHGGRCRGARRVRQHRRFLVSAAAGGATSVHLVDQSAPALANRRAQPRPQPPDRRGPTVRGAHRRSATRSRCSADLAKKGEQFDIVILDPPSFASNQAAVPRALAAYARLTRLGLARPRSAAACWCRRRARAGSPPTSSSTR